MEVFTGDHGLPSDVVLLPDTHLPPFPLPTADSLSDHRKISADHHHYYLPPPPPQKLRPIRYNGRNFSDCYSLDSPLDPKPLSWTPEAGFHNAETDSGGCIPPEPSNVGLSSNDCQTEPALCCSSDEISKGDPINKKKRKRKSRKKLELFMESMMKTVMEKQEEMHKQLIEMLEKRENESIKREEAWKKQQIERAKKDEQARKQQISQSLALISFIKNSLGQDFEIPNPIEKPGNSQDQESSKCDEGKDDIEMNNNIEESECDSNPRRWPKSEVQALITVRAAMNQKFNEKGPKGSIWEEVAGGLSSMGFNRTPKKCKEKWENINKYYKRTAEKGKKSAGKSQGCTYFSELEMLYKTGFISANYQEENQSMKSLQ